MRTVWQAEIDKFCNRVLAERFEGVPNYGDVSQIDGRRIEPADVICFGSPCQDLSVAGKRAGLEGGRSGLFFEATRIIRECKPSIAVWENVPGAFSSHAGRDFGAVVDTLAELGAHDVAWRVIDSRYAGVPQRRRRIYLVADFAGERAAEILFERESCGGHPAKGREAGEDVAATIRGRSSSPGINEPGRGGEDDSNLVVAGTLQGYSGRNHDQNYIPDVAGALDAAMGHHGFGGQLQGAYGGQNMPAVAWALQERDAKGPDSDTKDGHLIVTHPLRAESADAGEDGTGRGTPLKAQSGSDGRGVASPLVATTLTSGGEGRRGHRGDDGTDTHVIAGAAVRRLTPTECERLQGFPDGWTCLCGAGADLFACKCADGPRYRALGNAVTTFAAGFVLGRMPAEIETMGSLFSGIGGFELGAILAGN